MAELPEPEIVDIAENSCNTIPCMMPYITAFFMPRSLGDRPYVVPEGAINFAFIGQFAEMSGISQSNLSNYMMGKVSPTLETLNRIAEALGIDIANLFRKEEDVVLVVKYGGKTIILARFVPIVRTFAPFVAGIALMNPAQFFFFNIIGATAWVTGLVFMGFFLGNIPIVQENFSIVIYSIIIISISPVVFGFIRSILKKKG